MNPSDYYHAIPLHYVPYLLMSGTLYSQRRLAELRLPIRPRPTATKRDRKLHVDDYVHLSLTSITPLLIDKRRRGYPHALLEFGPEITGISGAAILKFNTKAWRHRDDFVPISDPAAFPAFFDEWSAGKFSSAEMMIPGELPLAGFCRRASFASEAELAWAVKAMTLLCLDPPVAINVGIFPPAAECDLTQHHAYLTRCTVAGELLAPPDLPFD